MKLYIFSVTQIERKLKHKNNPDLDLDVSLSKSKQNFDISSRQLRAFTQEWNTRQVYTISSFFTDAFAEVTFDALQKVAKISDENFQREKSSLKIFQQSINAIEKEDLSNSIAFDLKIHLDDQIEPKLADFDQSNEFCRQIHETKLIEIEKRLDRFAKGFIKGQSQTKKNFSHIRYLTPERCTISSAFEKSLKSRKDIS